MPEVAKGRLEDAGSWTYKINGTKLLVRNVESVGELTPIRNICLDKNGAWPTVSARCAVI